MMDCKSKSRKRPSRKFWDNFLHKRQSEEAIAEEVNVAQGDGQEMRSVGLEYDSSDSGTSDTGSSPEPSSSDIDSGLRLLPGSSISTSTDALNVLSKNPHSLNTIQTGSNVFCSLLRGREVPGCFKRWDSYSEFTQPFHSVRQLFETLGALPQFPPVLTYQKYSSQLGRSASLRDISSQEEPIDYSTKEKASSCSKVKEESLSIEEVPSISCTRQFVPAEPSWNSISNLCLDSFTGEHVDSSLNSARKLKFIPKGHRLNTYSNYHNLMSVSGDSDPEVTKEPEIALYTDILKNSTQEPTSEVGQVVMDIIQKTLAKKNLTVPQMSKDTILRKESSSDLFARALVSTGTRRPRGEKRPIPEAQKDDKYFERRRRNNLAAKKSRDNRKKREDLIAERAGLLERENAVLRAQVATMREEAANLRTVLFQRKQGIVHLEQRSSIYFDGDTIVPE